MAKYARRVSRAAKSGAIRTENLAGGEAFEASPKLAILSLLCTSMLKDQYYRTEQGATEEALQLLSAINDKQFVAKAAVYARTKHGLRSITHLIAAALTKEVKAQPWVTRFLDKVIYRVDDAIEILACYMDMYGKRKLPSRLKRGIGRGLGKFDEYQIAKYRREGTGLSLVDVVNICHPVPTERNKEALHKLINGNLVSTDTWEAMLTATGTIKDEDKRNKARQQVWFNLLKSSRMPYFALLRNLRNILAEADSETITMAFALLTSPEIIAKSLVLPFRYVTAIQEIQKTNFRHTRQALVCLDQAVEHSVNNVPQFEGNTLIAVDTSGSMTWEKCGKGEYAALQMAAIMAAALYKNSNADMILFSDVAKYMMPNPMDAFTSIANQIMEKSIARGTDFRTIFGCANKRYDRIIIISDMQAWMGYAVPTGTFAKYKTKYKCNPKIFSIDIAGYGTLQFPEREVYCLAGFSEKIFDVIKLLDTDKKAFLKEIEEIEL